MKVVIAYPPLKNQKGCPTLGQNRQFQYFKEPTYIYPVVPAQAATLLKKNGFEVTWLDCIAEEISEEGFFAKIKELDPDLIAFETKTPVVKHHWKIISQLKTLNSKLKTVLFGDHVTALPEESFWNSEVDFVLTGGDYDFLLLDLCQNLDLTRNSELETLNYKFEPGIWYRQGKEIRNTGKFELNHNLDKLPIIDRDLTKWQHYAFKNGNYKRTPGTYIMSGRDCWYHACTFCSWPTLYPKFRARSVENVLDEIGGLIKNYKIAEVMDDTGCFPSGDWLHEFCKGFVQRGFNKSVYFDCNMRFGALTKEDFRLMKEANFRLLLFGLESASQKTLDRINKGVKLEQIIDGCKEARRAGLFPHITIMFGYPWENFEDAKKTLKLGSWLLRKGYAYTMQATLVIPYPGSPLFEECKSNGWLRSMDWDDYDMKQPIMKSPIADVEILKLIRGMYNVSFHPEFIARKILSLRDAEDFSYFARAGKKVFGHLFDFHRNLL